MLTRRLFFSGGLLLAAWLGGCAMPEKRPDLSAWPGNGQGQVAWADLNGDGHLDLITAVEGFDCYKGCPDALARGESIDSGEVVLNFGNGRGQLGAPQWVRAGWWPSGVTAADLDGDGDYDLLVTDRVGEGVNVLLNDGRGHFRHGPKPPTGSMPENIVAGDLNGDRRPDYATACVNTGDVSLGFGNGRGGFTTRRLDAGGEASYVALADLDGDHDLDLLALTPTYQGDAVQVCFNDGHGRFSGTRRVVDSAQVYFFPEKAPHLRPRQRLPTGKRPTRLVTGDLDGDGDLDLLTANADEHTVSCYFNDGQGHFQAVAPTPDHAFGTGPYYLALADLDGDHDLDLLTKGFGDSIVYLRYNDGHGQFSAEAASPNLSCLIVSPHMEELRVADLNRDGQAELFARNGEQLPWLKKP